MFNRSIKMRANKEDIKRTLKKLNKKSKEEYTANQTGASGNWVLQKKTKNYGIKEVGLHFKSKTEIYKVLVTLLDYLHEENKDA